MMLTKIVRPTKHYEPIVRTQMMHEGEVDSDLLWDGN